MKQSIVFTIKATKDGIEDLETAIEFLSNPENEWIWHPVQALLVIFGFWFVGRQLSVAQDQNSISHLNYFREVWNSEALLRARLAVASHTNPDPSEFEGFEDVLATFMEDLGAAISVGQVNTEHVWSYFSYYIDGYWLLLQPKVCHYQERTGDHSYFDGFKKLQKVSAKISRRKGSFSMPKSYVQTFRNEEIKVTRFMLSQGIPVADIQ